MDSSLMGFVTSFVPSSFEGFEMATFYSLARMKDRTRASWGALVGVLAVAAMLYLTYLTLPALISDTGEHLLKLLLGFTFLALATFFLYREDYPEPRTAFLTALVGIVAEGAEVDLFSISAYLMTGSYFGILGGLVGFLWTLITFSLATSRVKVEVTKYVAITILYAVGFVVLTSGLI